MRDMALAGEGCLRRYGGWRGERDPGRRCALARRGGYLERVWFARSGWFSSKPPPCARSRAGADPLASPGIPGEGRSGRRYD